MFDLILLAKFISLWIAFLRSAISLARRLFSPTHLFIGRGDHVIELIARVRALAGIAIILSVSLIYGGAHQVDALTKDAMNVAVQTVVAVTAALAVGIPVVVLWTRSGFRMSLTRGLLVPPLSLVGYAGSWYALFKLTAFFDRISEYTQNNIQMIGTLIVLLAALWATIVLAAGLFYLAAGACRASDAHPLLGPIITPIVIWRLAELSWQDGGVVHDAPHRIAAATTFAGPISVTALSVLEVMRLGIHYPHDWPFRDGPL